MRKKEPCIDGSPGIVTDNDSSMVIAAIPETGYSNTLAFRISKALVIAFGTFLSGAWLLRPRAEKERTGALHHYGVRGAWLAIALLFIYQLLLVCRYSVDVPTQDEWMYFRSDGLINGFSLQWLYRFHNEHPFVFTKLMAWLNLKLFDLNLVLQNLVNFIVFGGLLATVAAFKNKVVGREQCALFPLFMIFLLSPINRENHLWALQSQYHLVLLFSLLALFHAFSRELTVKEALVFSLYAVLAIYTYSARVILVAIYLLCITVNIVAVIMGDRIKPALGWRFLLIACSVCGFSLGLWALGYETSAMPQPKIYPYELKFWHFFLNVISFGFGFEIEHVLPGIVCLSLVAFPLILLLSKKETRWQPSTWHVLSAVLAIFAVLASISLGRSWIYPAKTSRFAEFGFMLIPYCVLGWCLVMKEGLQKTAMLTFFWLFCFVAYLDDWSTDRYAKYKQSSLYDLQYIEADYAGAGDDICPEMSSPAPADLDRAKSLGVRFTRQFRQANQK